MTAREQILSALRALDRESLKQLGYNSLKDFCVKDLGYSENETREILVKLGQVLTRDMMVSGDAKTQERIDRLLQWRRTKALAEGVAAYRILSNRTLMKISEANPQTATELAQLPGIGPVKVAKLAQEILRTTNPN